jgi:hypothetical protein
VNSGELLARWAEDRKTQQNEHAVRPIYQGFALRWMNGWAFGPNDFPYFCAEQNRPAGSAEQGCKFHQFLAGDV